MFTGVIRPIVKSALAITAACISCECSHVVAPGAAMPGFIETTFKHRFGACGRDVPCDISIQVLSQGHQAATLTRQGANLPHTWL